jgi:uncharacterized protein (DUF1330 family)
MECDRSGRSECQHAVAYFAGDYHRPVIATVVTFGCRYRQSAAWRVVMRIRYAVGLSLLAGVTIGAAAVQGLHAQAKPKAYTITELQTIDAKAAADFAKRISEVQMKAGGRNFRTGGGKVVGLEGPAPPQRVAITEWDSLEKAEAFWKSKEWMDLGPERDKALKTIRRYAVEVVQ